MKRFNLALSDKRLSLSPTEVIGYIKENTLLYENVEGEKKYMTTQQAMDKFGAKLFALKEVKREVKA